MKTLLIIALVSLLNLTSYAATRQPLNRAYLQSNLNGNQKAITNVLSLEAGTVTAGQVTGSGSGLTDIPASAITNAGDIITHDADEFALASEVSGIDTNLFVLKNSVMPDTLLAPDTNGVASTNWVMDLVANVNQHYYFSTSTNVGIGSATNLSTMIDVPTATAATNTVEVPTAGVYFLSRITTNTISRIEQGPIHLNTYVYVTGGGGVQTMTAHPELWAWFTNDTIALISSSGPQLFSEASSPAIYNTTMNLTAATNLPYGSRLMLRWKADAVANTPTWNFVVGGNYDSHISVNVPLYSTTISASQVTGPFPLLQATTSILGTVLYPTNAGTQTITFGGFVEYRDFATNAAFAWDGFTGASSTNVQTAVYFITNSTASVWDMTPPAGMLATNGTWNVTNVTAVTFINNGMKWTNGASYPIK